MLALLAPVLAEFLLFLPDRTDPGPAPAVAGVRGRDLTLEASDGTRLHAWWWEAGPGAPAVLVLHGNAGHIGYRAPLAAGLVERGLSVLLLDYRGYGRSGGRPTEAGLQRDAEAALAFVAGEAGGPGRVVLLGRSMGAAVATPLAARREVAGLIVESAFTSLAEIGAAVYPWLPGFVFRGIRGRFDTRARMGEVDVPVLVVHGTRDALVPLEMGEAIHGSARPPKDWYAVEGAGHNDVLAVGGDAYLGRIAEFVRAVVEDAEGRPDER